MLKPATTILVILAAGLAGACSQQPSTSSLARVDSCAALRVAGEPTNDYVLCKFGSSGSTQEERLAAQIIADDIRVRDAEIAEAKCKTYVLTKDTNGYIKCYEHIAASRADRERAIEQAEQRNARANSNQAVQR